jgi:hypothetical protein
VPQRLVLLLRWVSRSEKSVLSEREVVVVELSRDNREADLFGQLHVD